MLCIIHAQESLIGNCIHLIESEPEEFPINIDVSHLFIGTQLFWVANLFVEIKFLPLSTSSNSIKVVETTFSVISECLMIPTRPLISQSFISTLTVNTTFAPIFNLSIFARPPVFDWLWFCGAVIWHCGILQFLGIVSME